MSSLQQRSQSRYCECKPLANFFKLALGTCLTLGIVYALSKATDDGRQLANGADEPVDNLGDRLDSCKVRLASLDELLRNLREGIERDRVARFGFHDFSSVGDGGANAPMGGTSEPTEEEL